MRNVVFNTKQVAEYLNCSVSLIRSLIKKNDIPHFKLGRKLNFSKHTIDSWIRKNEESSENNSDIEEILRSLRVNFPDKKK